MYLINNPIDSDQRNSGRRGLKTEYRKHCVTKTRQHYIAPYSKTP